MKSLRYVTLVSLVILFNTGVYGVDNLNQRRGKSPQLLSGKLVNVALPDWGTQIEATSSFSQTYSPLNLVDRKYVEGKNCWFSSDGAKLPQIVTFTFEKPRKLHCLKIFQADWIKDQYRTKDFDIEVSSDGQSWMKIADGTLKSQNPGEFAQPQFAPVMAKALRIVITSSYDPMLSRPAGLGEVEIYAMVQNGEKAPYEGATPVIHWVSFNRFFTLDLGLDPAPLSLWRPTPDNTETNQFWNAGPYRLEMSFEKISDKCGVMHYKVNRPDGKPFRMSTNNIEVKSSYASIYKIFHPGHMRQQTYKIDLPFGLDGVARAEESTPVIWTQDTSGHNTFTIGMLNQVPVTRFDGSTYDIGNGGEAQGIANSYVRIGFKRSWSPNSTTTSFSDGIYINADPNVLWYEALANYTQVVDVNRDYKPFPVSSIAFTPMWHTWYAHAADINQGQILSDAKQAVSLGFRTVEIDGGWNFPKSEGGRYSFTYEGDYDFNRERFPDANAMISQMHDLGLKVVLHVAPLVIGEGSKAHAQMADALVKVNGKPLTYLDPRLRKTQEYLFKSWTRLLVNYKMDGLWYDFLENIPENVDPPSKGMGIINSDMHEAYTMLMKSLLQKTKELNADAIIIMRRDAANLNAKQFCTHVWPMDVPQDYSMNRRDVVYMKTFGDGVLTHACCTSWTISETNENVARQMASITLAGVPAVSVKLAQSPERHNDIIRAWLKFYNANDRDLMMGNMVPLLPTPPSAAIRIESDKQAFFGFFEAVPGLVHVSKPFKKVTLINAFSDRLATRLEGMNGEFQIDVFDRLWKPKSTGIVKTDKNGLNLNIEDKSGCFAVVLTQKEQD
ncbi:MAG: hypothetical protein A2Y12_14770 [Planctomycetes bacterium GWF2_42_9]|nr:MAG: hypothetical protein A2Y12_14770 [Planctomycetes bacterium GWF2_42_9]